MAERRTEIFHARLTVNEADKLAATAALLGLTVSQLMQAVIRRVDVVALLLDLRGEVADAERETA